MNLSYNGVMSKNRVWKIFTNSKNTWFSGQLTVYSVCVLKLNIIYVIWEQQICGNGNWNTVYVQLKYVEWAFAY